MQIEQILDSLQLNHDEVPDKEIKPQTAFKGDISILYRQSKLPFE
ncbi:MAG: hypothetical protein WAO58_13610 [Fimbriimonadaceae bacterium]